MLQLRIKNYDGTGAVILEKAVDKNLFKSLSSADEGITFTIAKNDSKASILNPETGGYKRVWEVWDTKNNTRLNYGPISNITENGPEWKIEGRGRSAFLDDIYSTYKTFYQSIYSVIDSFRYENIAAEPRTTTIVHDTQDTAENTAVFGSITVDEKYHGLSQRTKDNAIDDDKGILRPGEIEPPNTYYTTDSFWAGMSKNDSLVIDLGGEYDLNKIAVNLPWWGGVKRVNNRSYDYTLDYATSTELPLTALQGRNIGPWHNIYDTGDANRISGNQTYIIEPGEITVRYLRIHIRAVNAWSGSIFDADPAVNDWDYYCDPHYSGSRDNPPMKDKTISDTTIGNANDCYAGVVEVQALTEIMPLDEIKPLALQRIDNNNLQITYFHTPLASETITTSAGLRKFEPGSFFRRFTVNYSGATNNYTKFYDADCNGCYPDPFSFAVLDQNNSLVYARNDASGTFTRRTGAQTKHLVMKGADNAKITYCDAWPATIDPLSWGGSYSHTKIINDYAVIHFRGQSFKWYATVPEEEVGATVSIELREKFTDGTWSSWSTLEAGYVLPLNIASQPVYAISYESGLLVADTVYEIKITNLDGNLCSIDSIEGYWSGSLTAYNEDSKRVFYSDPSNITQIYDKRFSSGSMIKWNTKYDRIAFGFVGDRVVVYSARGRHHGKISFSLTKFDPDGYTRYDAGTANHVFIPGGSPTDGSLLIDLDTGRRGSEYAQAIIFDSDDYFPNGLPWDHYTIHMVLLEMGTFTTTDADLDSNTFSRRCSWCKPPKGNTVTANRFIYLDGIAVHEQVGLSVSFENKTHLEKLTSVAEALQVEWDITDTGIYVAPRIGIDTNISLKEGVNTLVDWEIVNDIEKISTMLLSTGSDIDGLPLFTITEDKQTRADIGRTIMRQQDFRDIADYFTLIGLSREELKRRKVPEKRVTVTHVARDFELNTGDSFILFTKKMGAVRVRITKKTIQENSNGTVYVLECIKWDLTDVVLFEDSVPAATPGPVVDPSVPPNPEEPPEEIPDTPVEGPPPGGSFPDFSSRPASGPIVLNNVNGSPGAPYIIENLSFSNLGFNVIAITLNNCSYITIQNCDFNTVAEPVFAGDSDNIRLYGLRALNITGPSARDGHHRGNLVQFDHCDSCYVGYNKVLGGDTEDIVSLFASSNMVVEYNHFENPTWTSSSGTGIILGDGGGSHNTVRHNILLNPGQVGIQIIGGTGNLVTDNIVVGQQRSGSNVGMSIYTDGQPCSSLTINNNRVRWTKADGSNNSFYNDGHCGAPSMSGNVFDDTSLNPNDYHVTL